MDKMGALMLGAYTGGFQPAIIDTPKPGKGEVLIRVYASGVNPIDNKIKAGHAPYAMPNLPAVLGTDVAGVVEQLGEGVLQFSPGDEVYGLIGGVMGQQGSLAEYVAVDSDLLALKPSNLTMKEAAAIPLVILTAWEGIIDRVTIAPGQKVLVHGGAGGVGNIAVQLAKIAGAKVFATVSDGKKQFVESVGAVAIDYKRTTVQDYVDEFTDGDGFDIIYDTVGGKSLDDSLAAVTSYGHVISCAAFGMHNLAAGSLRCMNLHGIFVLYPLLTGKGRKHHGDILAIAAGMIERGQLKPMVDVRNFGLEDADLAYEAISDGSALGRIAITIK